MVNGRWVQTSVRARPYKGFTLVSKALLGLEGEEVPVPSARSRRMEGDAILRLTCHSPKPSTVPSLASPCRESLFPNLI